MEQSISSLAFKCGIPEAIAESQRSKKLFVVYISEGNDESSQLESETWTDHTVANFVSNNCILLHVRSGSTDAANFSAIYPQKSVPSITVVGYNGVQLWQNDGFIKAEDLALNLKKAQLSLFMQETTAVVLTGALYSSSDAGSEERKGSSLTAASPSSARTRREMAQEKEPEPEEHKALENETEIKKMVNGCSVDMDISSTEVPQNVYGNTKCLSSCGSDTNDDTCKSENELKLAEGSLKERSHDGKINHMDADESVMPEDGKEADKLSSGNQIKRVEHRSESEILETCPNEDDKYLNGKRDDMDKENLVTKSMDVSLSIRLPSGITLLEKFQLDDKLQIVKQYVDSKGNTSGNYDLAIPYPRKVFHDQDLDKSLEELSLSNRQALIIVPRHKASYLSVDRASETITMAQVDLSNDRGGYFAYAKRLLSLINPFSYFRMSASSASVVNSEDRLQEHARNSGGPDRSSPTSSRKIGQRTSNTTLFGSNIHTLRHDEDDRDSRSKNSYWNGNSTQYGGDGDTS